MNGTDFLTAAGHQCEGSLEHAPHRDILGITGFGEKRVMHPHHRPSAADGIAEPVPGLISGGPNKKWTYPATKERLGEDTPPARFFLDETPSADTNEIAVYWNSIAVFVFAYLNS